MAELQTTEAPIDFVSHSGIILTWCPVRTKCVELQDIKGFTTYCSTQRTFSLTGSLCQAVRWEEKGPVRHAGPAQPSARGP
jgi:hypothetical protein